MGAVAWRGSSADWLRRVYRRSAHAHVWRQSQLVNNAGVHGQARGEVNHFQRVGKVAMVETQTFCSCRKQTGTRRCGVNTLSQTYSDIDSLTPPFVHVNISPETNETQNSLEYIHFDMQSEGRGLAVLDCKYLSGFPFFQFFKQISLVLSHLRLLFHMFQYVLQIF